MPERVLAEPLSGEEVRKAVLDKIGIALQRDCLLSPNLAYDYFTCDVKLSLRCHDVGRTAVVDVAETVTAGDPADYALDAADAEFQIEAQPPNEVRVETGQPVPVLSRDKDGKAEVKHVKFGRKHIEKVAK